ncbi:MAG: hypothetical protein JSV49_09830 [Thermoplasmata archaeon]|nr:MAG: hypothetical protein JSV49_09830 [Thermoplasmata archaeon]
MLKNMERLEESPGFIDGENKINTDILIQDISNENSQINLLCRVLTINSKEYEKNGQNSTRYYGMLEDGTGTISFSAWRDLGLARNDIVRLTKARVRQWQGVLRLNIDKGTKVTKVTDESITGKFKTRQSPAPSRKLTINSLHPGLNNISCTCRIVSIEPIDIKLDGELKTVFKGVLADKTGSLRFTAWKDFELQTDMVIEIQNASVKVWRNFLEMNLNNSTVVIVHTKVNLPSLNELPIEERVTIGALYEREYITNPEFILEGTLIELKSGSGVIKRCTKCSRTVQSDECVIHGKVDPKYDLRIKAILDDGTGAVTILIGKELTEKLLNLPLKECIEFISKNDNLNRANELLLSPVMAQDVQVKGQIMRDDFGTTILATSANIVSTDPATVRSDAQLLLEAME